MYRSHYGAIGSIAILVAGCGSSGSDEVFREPAENQLPTADFTADPISGKEPLTDVSFDAARSSDPDGVIDQYDWNFGDGSSGSGRTISHDFASQGDYTVSLTVTDNDGGKSEVPATSTITVNANVAPTAAFTYSPTDPQPTPAVITFDATGASDSDGSIVDYQWDFGDSQFGTGRVVTHTFENPGASPVLLSVELTVTDDSGSASALTQDVTVLPLNQLPQASFTGCPITACGNPGDPPFYAPYVANFDATGSVDVDGQILRYEWDFGDGNTESKTDPAAPDFATASNVYVDSGAYVVQLTVFDNFDASGTTSADLIIDNLAPNAQFTAAPESGTAPLLVAFDATMSGDTDGTITRYEWFFGDGSTGSASVDADTGNIVESTQTGVGTGNGKMPNHLYSTVGSALSTRRIPSAESASIAVGDVDGNGVVDVVVCNFQKINQLFLNVGATTPLRLRRPVDVSTDLDGCMDIALADLNGDGYDDLITANGIINPDATVVGQENQIYLWNDAEGRFDDSVSLSPLDIDVSTSVTVGMVDAGSTLDIVIGNRDAPNRIYFGDGIGGVTASSDVSPDLNATADVVLHDVDNDLDLDILVANISGTNRLYAGDGNGNFSSGFDITQDVDVSTSLAAADVDGDGDPDLVVGNGDDTTGANNRLYLNLCDGICAADSNVFAGSAGRDIAEDTEPTTDVILVDVDMDGDVDLIASNAQGPSRLYVNHQNSAPFDAILFNDRIIDDPECESDEPATCDCNLDSPSGDACTTEAVSNGEFLIDVPIAAISATDLDDNSSPDLLTAGFGRENTVFLSTCIASCPRDSNPFAGAFPSQFPQNNTLDIALGDIDGDGDVDLVSGSGSQSSRVLYSVSGTAFALTRYIVASGSDQTRSVVLEDMDLDGDLDLVVGNAGQTDKYYVNTCDGICESDAALYDDPSLVFPISTDLANTSSLAVGDIDGDGDPDVVAGNGVFSDQPNRIFLNLCFEEFGPSGCPPNSNVFRPGVLDPVFFDISNEQNTTQSIALGDVDLDGLLDLVVGNEGQVNYVYINNCDPIAGCSPNQNPFPGPGTAIDAAAELETQFVALHDLDGDSDLDLVVGNAGDVNRVFLNQLIESGNFSFDGGADIGEDNDVTFSIAIGDLNGDGEADVVAGNDGINRVYYNAVGPGTFSAGSDGIVMTTDDDSTSVVKIFDVVESPVPDLRNDVVVGNAGSQDRIYYNGGTHIVRLRVTDNFGASTEAAVQIEALSN